MSDAAGLLRLQEIDTALDQLRHRRAHLDERTDLAAVDADRSALGDADDRDRDQLGELGAEQRRLEDEVAAIEDKVRRERTREATMTSPRELQAVEAELASLARRQSELEDRILELMEAAEPLQGAVEERGRRLDELAARREQLAEAIEAAEVDLDARIASTEQARPGVLADISDGQRRTYDLLRERMGGVVVGRLDGTTHTACSLQLPPVEVERLRDAPAGSLHTCDECGRLIALA